MVEPRETAEEQLLRFIEGSQPVRPVTPAVSASFPARVQAGLRRLWEWLGEGARGLLWLALFGVAAYAVLELRVLRIPRSPSAPPLGGAQVESAGSASATIPAADAPAQQGIPRPFPDDLTAERARNPFRTGLEAGWGLPPLRFYTGESREAGLPLSARRCIEDLSRNLVVVGIDRGAHPVAFIENVQEKRTYLVGVGDRLNGMGVEEIGPKGVLLSYEGKEVLLP